MEPLLDEVESLEAILMDDVRITRNSKSNIPEIIETTIYPVVERELEEQQYVCVTLQVLPTKQYPDESPQFKLIRPRGLDDVRLENIKSSCIEKLQELIGSPVVFDLIETIRELLTDSNVPSGQCVICLYGFSDGDEFTRTECFHFLHSYCLARHLNAMRKNYQEEYNKLPTWLQRKADPFQAVCPVCRENIKDDSDSVKCAMPPTDLQNAPVFQLTNELRELQERMNALYLQQKERGGIIDLDAEKATIISIETEQELQRRLKRENAAENAQKQREEMNENNVVVKPSSSRDVTSNTTTTTNDIEPKHNHHPNNYNKRHYRGGRRHQYYNNHQREERERERFDYKHMTSQEATATNNNGNKNSNR